MVANPWGTEVLSLALGPNLDPLLKGTKDILPKFNGDRKKSTDEHLNDFNTSCGIHSVPIENLAIRLSSQSLTNFVMDWFQHFPNGATID